MRQWQADEIRAVIEMLATAQEDGYRTAEGRRADPFNDGFPYVCGVLQARIDIAAKRLEKLVSEPEPAKQVGIGLLEDANT
jgi:hypothetical protein